MPPVLALIVTCQAKTRSILRSLRQFQIFSLYFCCFLKALITVNDPNKKNENKVSAFLLVASFFRKLLQSRREGKWRRQ